MISIHERIFVDKKLSINYENFMDLWNIRNNPAGKSSAVGGAGYNCVLHKREISEQ